MHLILWLFWATRGTPTQFGEKVTQFFFCSFSAKCMFLTGLTQLVGARLHIGGLKKFLRGGFMDMHAINFDHDIVNQLNVFWSKDTYFREMADFTLIKNKQFSNSFFWTWAHETHQCCRPIGPSKMPG